MADAVSIKPSEMVAGGAVPVDLNLTVREARFVLFDYGGKGKQTTAARLNLVDDEGVENEQHYSVADPTRFVPSQDGKSVVPVGAAANLNTGSNFFILMRALVDAGFPEDKLGADISALDGLYAFWIGVKEPDRPGLVRTAEQQARGPKVLSVPSKILAMPGEKKPAAGASSAAPPVAAGGTDAMDFVKKVLEKDTSITRQDLATRVFTDLASDPNRDAIATAIFSPAFQAQLVANGLKLDGETISKG